VRSSGAASLTKAGREQLGVEVGEELLALGVEHAQARDNVARSADADNLHDGLEDEEGEVGKVGMRAVVIVEDAEHAAVAVVVGLRGHGDKVGRRGRETAQTQCLGRREKGHGLDVRVWRLRCL